MLQLACVTTFSDIRKKHWHDLGSDPLAGHLFKDLSLSSMRLVVKGESFTHPHSGRTNPVNGDIFWQTKF